MHYDRLPRLTPPLAPLLAPAAPTPEPFELLALPLPAAGLEGPAVPLPAGFGRVAAPFLAVFDFVVVASFAFTLSSVPQRTAANGLSVDLSGAPASAFKPKW